MVDQGARSWGGNRTPGRELAPGDQLEGEAAR